LTVKQTLEHLAADLEPVPEQEAQIVLECHHHGMTHPGHEQERLHLVACHGLVPGGNPRNQCLVGL
jgi:hypothetical protein